MTCGRILELDIWMGNSTGYYWEARAGMICSASFFSWENMTIKSHIPYDFPIPSWFIHFRPPLTLRDQEEEKEVGDLALARYWLQFLWEVVRNQKLNELLDLKSCCIAWCHYPRILGNGKLRFSFHVHWRQQLCGGEMLSKITQNKRLRKSTDGWRWSTANNRWIDGPLVKGIPLHSDYVLVRLELTSHTNYCSQPNFREMSLSLFHGISEGVSMTANYSSVD